MASPTEFILARHGQTDWNLERRLQGRSDIPLNPTGYRQMQRLSSRLRDQAFDRIVSSPLTRARQSAEVLREDLDLGPIQIMEEFIERSHGRAEGLEREQIHERFGGFATLPEAETIQKLLRRVLGGLKALDHGFSGEKIIIVSHSGVIGALVELATNQAAGPHLSRAHNGDYRRFSFRNQVLTLLKPYHAQTPEPYAAFPPNEPSYSAD